MNSVLKTLSEYTYFYISKNITSYTFIASFSDREKLSVYSYPANVKTNIGKLKTKNNFEKKTISFKHIF